MARLISVLLFLFMLQLCSMSVLSLSDAPDSASFVFGDSLVDAGNNNYLQTLSKADITPNGIDFTASGGQPTGRFTNGRTIADIVGSFLLFLCFNVNTYMLLRSNIYSIILLYLLSINKQA